MNEKKEKSILNKNDVSENRFQLAYGDYWDKVKHSVDEEGFTNKLRTMKEKIAEMYAQALIDDLAPNVFADQVLRLFGVSGSLDLDSLEKKLDEALSKETPESLKEWLNGKRQ
jgi:phage shock protein A